MTFWNDAWINKNCKGFPRDPDNWRLQPWFADFCNRYRVENRSNVTDDAIWFRCVHVRKRRHVTKEGDPTKLRKFPKNRRKPMTTPWLTESRKETIRELYRKFDFPIDRMPLVVEHKMFAEFQAKHGSLCNQAEFHRALERMRKRGEEKGGLPRLRDKKSPKGFR